MASRGTSGVGAVVGFRTFPGPAFGTAVAIESIVCARNQGSHPQKRSTDATKVRPRPGPDKPLQREHLASGQRASARTIRVRDASEKFACAASQRAGQRQFSRAFRGSQPVPFGRRGGDAARTVSPIAVRKISRSRSRNSASFTASSIVIGSQRNCLAVL